MYPSGYFRVWTKGSREVNTQVYSSVTVVYSAQRRGGHIRATTNRVLSLSVYH